MSSTGRRQGSSTSPKSARKSSRRTVLKPSQRVRAVLTDDHRGLRFNAAVASAFFEIPARRGPSSSPASTSSTPTGTPSAPSHRHKRSRCCRRQPPRFAERLGAASKATGTSNLRVASIEQARASDLTFIASPSTSEAREPPAASAVIVDETLDTKPIRSPPAPCCAAAIPTHPSPGGRAVRAKPPASQRSGPAQLGRARRRGCRRRVDRSVRRDRVAGASVGAGTTIYPNVVIGRGANHRRRLHPALPRLDSGTSRAGRSGNGPERRRNRTTASATRRNPMAAHLKIPQQGRVVIEDDVEIGANRRSTPGRRGDADPGRHEDRQPGQIGHGVTSGAGAAGLAGRDLRQRCGGRRRRDGGSGGCRRPPARREGRHRGRQERHHQVGGGRANFYRVPGIPNLEWRKASVIFRRLPDEETLEELEQLVATRAAHFAGRRPLTPARQLAQFVGPLGDGNPLGPQLRGHVLWT